MDKQKAEEILDSYVMINVNYHGIPVYIQALNADDETATVFPLDEMDHEQVVDLNGLREVELGNVNKE
ncbi:small acid-soluble spore protein H (minor) [Virgibacillus natechei]|uniref:Small, acid-soluble spore protein H n=1 Tax=Virgibacillus natechei TaxID=1216297 RepID=A0ABS4IGW5_9BACI|nr:H-type small acid-soluble spore protein [Virgibacillus natechei]MBP1970189.1 small acid-soluble spore protein H (minor) [Virgibacillus natechei]UZD12859.1 H-type small acid-soluble spore protein [Virgibacillus natechei]